MEQNKRFEEWEEVDCNECERWWINQCDGASKGSKKGCNSYLATRSVVLPAKINALEKRLTKLELLLWACCLVNAWLIIGLCWGWF